ncbi:hypothetical protein [Roseibium album]|uniref:hypothetical protein n=1 Tax=Roseibium album TaxID=311410 RepID=UPI0024929AFD|nr:hypothetical protein [Roseibium album]
MGTAIHLLVWDKQPEKGAWFKTPLENLPRPLQSLCDQWYCPCCAGFWIALVLHALTGFWILPDLENLPSFVGVLREPVAWTLDALATATLIYAAILKIKAIGLPAMKARMMKAEFPKSALPAQLQDK